mmetsp:Transcript_9495/g.26240  ORF Transcript_9495/g.26240 Transcript_9495/m.26240 type:complete len:106 (+) Transcript_9495:279-596(+)
MRLPPDMRGVLAAWKPSLHSSVRCLPTKPGIPVAQVFEIDQEKRNKEFEREALSPSRRNPSAPRLVPELIVQDSTGGGGKRKRHSCRFFALPLSAKNQIDHLARS